MDSLRPSNHALRHVVCAVDPYESGDAALTHLAAAIECVVGTDGGTIEAVYVMSSDDSAIPGELFAKWAEDHRKEAEVELRAKLARVQFTTLPRSLVLVESGPDRQPAAARLAKHAASSDASLIAAHTYGRRGLARQLLGSFAETLLAHSDIPVLLVNPSAVIPARLSSIFFPTSFSETAKLGLPVATSFAKATGASLHFYHEQTVPANDRGVPHLGHEGERWASWTRRQGIEASFTLEATDVPVSADSILAALQRSGAAAIALFPDHDPDHRAVFGSITREIIRNAKVPILALRTR